MKKVNITKLELLNHSCTVKGFFKFGNRWIEYRCFSWGNQVWTPLN